MTRIAISERTVEALLVVADRLGEGATPSAGDWLHLASCLREDRDTGECVAHRTPQDVIEMMEPEPPARQ